MFKIFVLKEKRKGKACRCKGLVDTGNMSIVTQRWQKIDSSEQVQAVQWFKTLDINSFYIMVLNNKKMLKFKGLITIMIEFIVIS